MTTLSFTLNCSLIQAAQAIRRETRHSEITSFKVRDGFVTVEYHQLPDCDHRFVEAGEDIPAHYICIDCGEI